MSATTTQPTNTTNTVGASPTPPEPHQRAIKGEQGGSMGDLFADQPMPTGARWVSVSSSMFPAARLLVDGRAVVEVRHCGHPTALRPYWLSGPAIERAPVEYGLRKFSRLADAKRAAEQATAACSPTVDELRATLRDVEWQILQAAPKRMQVGGGDIEAAARHPNVPKGLREARGYVKARLRELLARSDCNKSAGVVNNAPAVFEQRGQYFVRLGDDRAAIGPMKSAERAQEYAQAMTDTYQEHLTDSAPCASRWDGFDRGDADWNYDDEQRARNEADEAELRAEGLL